MADVPHSVILSTLHDKVVPFSEMTPTDFSKLYKLPLQACWHTEQLAETGSPYFTTSLGGVNTGLSVQFVSVRPTLDGMSLNQQSDTPVQHLKLEFQTHCENKTKSYISTICCISWQCFGMLITNGMTIDYDSLDLKKLKLLDLGCLCGKLNMIMCLLECKTRCFSSE